MKRLLIPAVASLAALAVAVPAVSAPKTVTLTAKLSGKQEVPNAGDPNGTGKAVVRLNAGRGTVCYELTVNKIAGSTAGHIHEGAKGVAGPVRVALFGKAITRKNIKDCTRNVPADQIKKIIAKPSAFYVNVHNADFPGGAIRGQLRR